MSDVILIVGVAGIALISAALAAGFMQMKAHDEKLKRLEAQDETHAKDIADLAVQLKALTDPHTRAARARQDTAEEAQFAIGSIMRDWEVLQRKLEFVVTLNDDAHLLNEKMNRAQERIARAGRGETDGRHAGKR